MGDTFSEAFAGWFGCPEQISTSLVEGAFAYAEKKNFDENIRVLLKIFHRDGNNYFSRVSTDVIVSCILPRVVLE